MRVIRIVAAFLLIATPLAAQQPGIFAGLCLEEALQELKSLYTMELIYSNDLVRSDLRVIREPSGVTPREILDDMLSAFGLKSLPGPSNSLMIVESEQLIQRQTAIVQPAGEYVVVPFVTVTMSAMDSSDHFITNLKPSDVVLKEEGIEQSIQDFMNLSRTGSDRFHVPLSIAFVLDSSESMNSRHSGIRRYDVVKSSSLRLINDLRDGDKMMMLGFNSGAWTIADMTDNRWEIRDRLKAQTVQGGKTAVFDAVRAAVDLLQPYPGRKVVVLGSDGEDNASRMKIEELLSHLEYSQVVVYAFGTAANNEISARGRKALEQIAEATGGYAFFPKSIGDLHRVTTEVSKAIQSQYLIGYAPPNPTARGLRQIEIEPRIPGLRLRYRKAYLF